jgi:hypothetical protein
MSTPQPADLIYQLLLQLWKTVEENFPYWHGWAFRNGENGPELVFYIVPGADYGNLLHAAANLTHLLRVKIVLLERFQRVAGSNGTPGGKISLRAGSSVHAVSLNPQCKKPCQGTIAAFLRARGTAEPIWLLSNHHVLVKDPSCLPMQVFTEDGSLISKSVLPVPLNIDGNRVDAAVAKLIDPGIIAPVYDPVEITSTDPIPPVKDDAVQKFGAFTHQTCGKVLEPKCTMRVPDCLLKNNQEFVDQIMIAPLGESGFADRGDSGSLVVSAKKPLGLLFAISHLEGSNLITGLVSPWQAVLDEVSKIIPGPLEMMLAAGSNFENPCVGLAVHQ